MITPPSGRVHSSLSPATGVDAAVLTAGHARRRLGLAAAAFAVLTLVIGIFAGLAPSAAAAGAAVNQCNGVYNTGGQEISCHVIINNRLDLATGVSSSSGTIQECHGPNGAQLLCTTKPVASLSTTVDQCNGSALGGGATVTCSVVVTNTITGDGTTAPITVNQCIGSGTGGGAAPTTQCNPTASTTNADITQCNGSANGGGASRRVKCTVNPSTSTTALPITIHQCNGSAAGGSLVTCTATITNIFRPATTTTPTSTTATTTTATTTSPTGTATTASTSRTRPSATVRPTVATRPTTAGSGTATGSRTGVDVTGSARTTTAGSGTGTGTNTNGSNTETNGFGTATASTTSGGTTTALPNTGAPAGRQALLAVMLLAVGAAFMLLGRRPRWVGKHR